MPDLYKCNMFGPAC